MFRLIDIAATGAMPSEILKSLYYTFIDDRFMARILIKAMKRPPSKGFSYVYYHIGCKPMKKLHTYILDRNAVTLGGKAGKMPEDIVKELRAEVDTWSTESAEDYRMSWKKKIEAAIVKNLLLFANLYLYINLKTEISLWIFVFVNTAGVILNIVLDYECCIKDRRLGMIKNKTHPPAAGLHIAFQMIGGLGLIINISTAVAGWLGPIA
ncbi:hypothetical protein [Pseudobutyrivibrio xylanivorans]|uniref:Uncharacterized protein n=1 Tax=Pseudobutyrivibrio xylanivorans TaxID=185007 RepID=A0A5P6VMV6_PSEXY|nr:hypothetical protein [Pseudobutyrivibrio xylanivorans]QFJ53742.1 hypothetical protein FXF36_02085 [Pseudobutyrivibrio xylanivorans]